MEPEQNAITESVDRLAGHIDALAAAVSAAAETLCRLRSWLRLLRLSSGTSRRRRR